MKKIIVLLGLVFCVSIAAKTEAQTWVRIKQGQAADTLKKSTTYNNIISVNASDLQTVSVQVMIDSVSGTPRGTATLFRSVDGINWETTGKAATWAVGRDTSFILTDTSFYGTYAKVAIVTTSATQKSYYYLTLKSWNK